MASTIAYTLSPREDGQDKATPRESDAGGGDGPRKTSWPLGVMLALATGLDVSCHSLQVPMLPALRVSLFNDSPQLLSLYFYIYGAFGIIAFFLFPQLGKRFSARTIILRTQLVFVVCCLILWPELEHETVNPHIWRWFAVAARAGQGLCSGLLWVSAGVFLYDELHADNPDAFQFSLTLQYASESVAYAVAPLVGGYLYRHSFALIAGLALVLNFALTRVTKDSGLRAIDPSFSYSLVWEYYRKLPIMGLLMFATILVSGTIVGALELLVPQLLSHRGMAQEDLGLLFGLYGIAVLLGISLNAVPWLQRLAPDRGKVYLVSLAMICFTGTFAMTWVVCTYDYPYWMCAIAMFGIGVLDGFLVASTGVILADAENELSAKDALQDVVPQAQLEGGDVEEEKAPLVEEPHGGHGHEDFENRTDVVISFITFQIIWDLGLVFGPFVAGFVHYNNHDSVWYVCGALTIVAGITAIVLVLKAATLRKPVKKTK